MNSLKLLMIRMYIKMVPSIIFFIILFGITFSADASQCSNLFLNFDKSTLDQLLDQSIKKIQNKADLSPDFTLKALTNTHESRIVSSWFYGQWAKGADLEIKEIIRQDIFSSISSNKLTRFVLMQKKDELLGVASLAERDMGKAHPEFTPWLAGVFVSPNFRSQGIGKVLNQVILEYAKKLGFKKIYLFTDSKQNWYISQGWRIISSEQYHGNVVSVMSIDLDR